MTYTYPDKNDRLTCELIEREFDGVYWGKSEELVLGQALEEAVAFLEELGRRSGMPEGLLIPLYKVAGIALVVKVGGGLCADAGESALAAVVETAGSVCALAAALPLLRTVLELLMELMA